MAITRAKKESLLHNLTEVLQGTASAIFVGFKGLTVAEVNTVRGALKKNNIKYQVAKKTLLKKALTAKGYEGEMPELPGEIAVVYLTKEASTAEDKDITAPARELNSFVKKLTGKLSLLGGVLEGKYLSQSEALQIAATPSLTTLRGMFVNVINSPIQRFAIAMSEVAKKKS